MTLRYAIYFSPPPDDSLTEASSRWLGRDAFSGTVFGPPTALAMPAGEWQGLVRDPQRYGFHATLKAPFELCEGQRETDLIEAFDNFAASKNAFNLPRIVIDQLGPFFALVPDIVYPPMHAFCASIVETFEPFRAPLSKVDIDRRHPDRLSNIQRDNLVRWGYPYVMDEFRFHMTLTGPVQPARVSLVRRELEQRFSQYNGHPLQIGGLALFIETHRGAPFTVHRWQPLGTPEQNREILP